MLPLSNVELFQSTLFRPVDTPYFGELFIFSASPNSLFVCVGQKEAKISYVTLPNNEASKERICSRLNSSKSLLKYGNCQFSGASMTPSRRSEERRVGKE